MFIYMLMYFAGGDSTRGLGGLREEKKEKMTEKMSNYIYIIYTHTHTHTYIYCRWRR